jgi:hypothetical protein
MVDETFVQSVIERLLDRAQPEDLQFERGYFYLWASIMAWGVFWELAERHHDEPHAQFMVWTFVFVAAWVTDMV